MVKAQGLVFVYPADRFHQPSIEFRKVAGKAMVARIDSPQPRRSSGSVDDTVGILD